MTEEGCFNKAVAVDDIHVVWQYSAGQPKALVHLSGELVVSVGVNDKPGYSRFASKNGPLAKVLAVPEY
jgi:hypothetical protein